MEIAYLNGAYMPLAEAHVPVLDRGFLFADGVYELVPAYGGFLFGLEQHLERLQHSLDGISLQNPLSFEEWTETLKVLAERAGKHDQNIYFQITRGVSEKRAHVFPDFVKPTVFAMSTPMQAMPATEKERGISVITHADIRWEYCHLKTISLLGNVLMQQHAREVGAHEALTLRDGLVTEGSSSNLFIVLDGVLITPPKSERLLPGITREFVLQLAKKHQLPHRENDISVAQLKSAEEVWITSSSREVIPVVKVDEAIVGDGKAGPIWRQMLAYFEALKESLRAGQVAF